MIGDDKKPVDDEEPEFDSEDEEEEEHEDTGGPPDKNDGDTTELVINPNDIQGQATDGADAQTNQLRADSEAKPKKKRRDEALRLAMMRFRRQL